jgi:hypothetical protein
MQALHQHRESRAEDSELRGIEIELLNSRRQNDLEGLGAIGWELRTEFATT